MARKKADFPKLFQRAKGGSYYFRRVVDGRDTRINTHTSDYQQAEKFLRTYVSSQMSAEVSLRQGANASRIAHAIIKNLNGTELQRLTFEEAWEFWLRHNPDFQSNCERYREQLEPYFSKFAAWCHSQGITYIDEVDASIAIHYAGTLKNKPVSATTFNNHRQLLSRVFAGINAFKQLPNGNPFDRNIVKPQYKPPVPEATHQPLEPDMMTAVINTAAEIGQDWLDFFIVGAQTGMRLKDAALFRWEFIKGGFIEFRPEKTIRHGSMARLPISPTLAELLNNRKKQNQLSPYVNPQIAQGYLSKTGVSKKSKDIFEAALGKETTQLSKEGRQRQRNGCIYSFHSFRTTLMSLLAAKQVPIRDAMTIFGWESMEMVRIYTKMLEQARGDMDERNRKVFDNLSEINFGIPEVTLPPKSLKPPREALQKLVQQYSNRSIGVIYDISDSMVSRWMIKLGVTRTRRIIDNGIEEEAVIRIREELQAA